MTIRSIGVSEARRRLPAIVRTLAEEGGRVDVTLRGQPRVSIVRTADVARPRAGDRRPPGTEVLRVEFPGPPAAVLDAIRELRSRRAPCAVCAIPTIV
jgi:hypothetical protein